MIREPDPDYRIITYRSDNADAGKEWLARVTHPKTQLVNFFEAPTEEEVQRKAGDWWEKYRVEREANWARKEASRASAAAAAARKKGKATAE